MIKKNADIVHIDEFCTSKKCYKCGNDTDKRRYVLNKNGRVCVSNGVLCCKNSNKKCGTTYDRDINGSKNIIHILYNYLHGYARPSWLQR